MKIIQQIFGNNSGSKTHTTFLQDDWFNAVEYQWESRALKKE